MARQLRLEYKGAIYHITVRSNGKEDLFEDDPDRVYLLGRFMQSLLTGYTVYFNLRHRRHGHVTQGRYGARVGGKIDARRSAYRDFVEDGLRQPDETFAGEMWRSPRSIGTGKFRQWIDDLYGGKLKNHSRKEDVSFRKEARKSLSAKQVEAVVAKICGVRVTELKASRRVSFAKGVAGMMLVKYANLTQREVAVRLGLTTGSGVSYQVRKLRRQMEHKTEVRQRTAEVTTTLDAMGEHR